MKAIKGILRLLEILEFFLFLFPFIWILHCAIHKKCLGVYALTRPGRRWRVLGIALCSKTVQISFEYRNGQEVKCLRTVWDLHSAWFLLNEEGINYLKSLKSLDGDFPIYNLGLQKTM